MDDARTPAIRLLTVGFIATFTVLAASCAATKFESGTRAGVKKQPQSEDAHQATNLPVGDKKKLVDLINDGSPKSVEPQDPNIVKYDPATGQLIGVSPGTTDVVVKLSDGTTNTVQVTVTAKDVPPGGTPNPGNGGSGSDESISGFPIGVTSGEIPGIAVVRVGINFEDLGALGDRDYNDAVLCFQGNFKVNGADVVSTSDQTVTGTTSSHSGCKHNIRVEITDANGMKQAPIAYDSRAPAPVAMNFKTGSKLEVFMTPYEGCKAGVQHTQHEPDYARVLPDVCNTSGN